MTKPTARPEYTMYVDESGHAGMSGPMTHDNERYLCLVGVIVKNDIIRQKAIPQIDQIKMHTLGNKNIPFHIVDMMRNKKSFRPLRDKAVRGAFFASLQTTISDIDHTVVCALIDKKEMIRIYGQKAREPYRFALQIILERFALFLDEAKSKGKVVAESRNSNVDFSLNTTYKYYWQNVNAFNRKETVALKSVITSKNIKFYKKNKCIHGLEIADLYAYALKAWGIANYPNMTKAYPPLRQPSDQLLKICLQSKIRRVQGGFIGCGYKKYPG